MTGRTRGVPKTGAETRCPACYSEEAHVLGSHYCLGRLREQGPKVADRLARAEALATALDFFWDAVAAEDAERIQAECDCAPEACHHQVTVAFDRARAALEAWRKT